MTDLEKKAQEDKQMKESFMNSFNEIYSKLITFMNKLPVHDILRSHAFMNLDQGAYWAREGIANMVFNFVPPAPVVAEQSFEEQPVEVISTDSEVKQDAVS